MKANIILKIFRGFMALVFFTINLIWAQNIQELRSKQSNQQQQYNTAQDASIKKGGVNKKDRLFFKKIDRKKKVDVSVGGFSSVDSSKILAKIGEKVIFMDEFIRRAEYTIRPPYCQGSGGFEKKIILNSLLAEKMLALEAGKDNELFKNESFQRLLQGRKEQLMRQVLYNAEGTSKVHLDTAEIKREYKIAGRTYHLEFFDVPNDSAAKSVKKILDTSAVSFNAIYRELSGRDSLPHRDVNWSSSESRSIRKALFKNHPKVNQIIGPLQVGEENYLFIRIKGWTDAAAISETQVAQRLNDVREGLIQEKADDRYEKYVLGVMDKKTLQLEPTAFRKFAEIIESNYLESKKEKDNKILDEAFKRQPQENPEFDDIKRNLDALRSAPLFTIDSNIWTVEDVTKEMERHPLVFRNKNLNKKNFSEQLKLAIVDMVRDRYLTNVAYKRGYDKNSTVAHYTEMWQDAMLGLWQKDIYLNSIGVTDNGEEELVTKYVDPYIDSLRHKYSDSTEINTDAFNEFKLTGLNTIVLEKNVPFTLYVPSFPQLTSHKWLDYGRKMNMTKKNN